MELSLSIPAVQAMFHVLGNTEPKGRTEIRLHSRILRILDKDCTIEGGTHAKAAVVNMDDSLIDFFKMALNIKSNAGIPGSLSKGYSDLFDLFE